MGWTQIHCMRSNAPLDELSTQNREVAAAIEKTTELRGNLTQCLATQKAASTQLVAAERDKESRRNEVTSRQTELQNATNALRQLQSDAEGWKRVLATLAGDEKNLAKKLESKENLQAELVAATKTKQNALVDLTNATAAVEVARRASGAAALAEHLHAGDSCPICSRKLPPTFKPPASADFPRPLQSRKPRPFHFRNVQAGRPADHTN